MLTVLICGSRHFTTSARIEQVVNNLPQDATVVVGGARGADFIAERAARSRGLHVEVYRARWDLHGKAAGPIRNQQMADRRPNIVIAFIQDEMGRGTGDMVTRARRAGIPVAILRG